jgi:hypothetical protein
MKRFGILGASFDVDRDPIDVYETDRRYWQSLWYCPSGAESAAKRAATSQPGGAQ